MQNQEVLAAAIAARLAVSHGEVMLSADLADTLHMTGNALRLELSRGGDVPHPAPLPGKGHRWLVTDVAVWLAARSTAPADQENDGHLDVQTTNAVASRGPGRPRKQAPVAAPQTQGVGHD